MSGDTPRSKLVSNSLKSVTEAEGYGNSFNDTRIFIYRKTLLGTTELILLRGKSKEYRCTIYANRISVQDICNQANELLSM